MNVRMDKAWLLSFFKIFIFVCLFLRILFEDIWQKKINRYHILISGEKTGFNVHLNLLVLCYKLIKVTKTYGLFEVKIQSAIASRLWIFFLLCFICLLFCCNIIFITHIKIFLQFSFILISFYIKEKCKNIFMCVMKMITWTLLWSNFICCCYNITCVSVSLYPVSFHFFTLSLSLSLWYSN